VLPDIPQRSLDTIQGTVRVGIRVQVDSAGNVVDTAVDFEGPSRYFARLAEKAARRWKFAPSDNLEREFILHFDFRNAVTSVSATEVAQ
jgi:TonB family protein